MNHPLYTRYSYPRDALRSFVKIAASGLLASAACLAAPSFAANAPVANAPAQQAIAAVPAQQQAPVHTDVQAYGKTRAQVYQELVNARRSGELARLDATYTGG